MNEKISNLIAKIGIFVLTMLIVGCISPRYEKPVATLTTLNDITNKTYASCENYCKSQGYGTECGTLDELSSRCTKKDMTNKSYCSLGDVCYYDVFSIQLENDECVTDGSWCTCWDCADCYMCKVGTNCDIAGCRK